MGPFLQSCWSLPLLFRLALLCEMPALSPSGMAFSLFQLVIVQSCQTLTHQRFGVWFFHHHWQWFMKPHIFLQDLNFPFAIDLCITNVLTYKNLLPRPGFALLIVSMWEQTTHQFISSKFIHTPRTYVSQVSLRSWALGIENNNIWAVKTLHHSVTTLLVLANLMAPRQFLVKNFLLKSTITEKDPSDPC